MLSGLAILTSVVPLISALTLNVPTNLSSGGIATVTWSPDPATDPAAFTLELINTVFHNSFAIGNNLQPSAASATFELPIVPAGSGYTLQAVQIGNITNVYSTSGSFSIAPTISSSFSSMSSSSGVSSSSGTIATPLSTTPFGVTTTPTSITPAGSGSSTGTTAAAAASSSTSSFNAASSLNFKFSMGSVTVVLLSAVAGAAIVAL